MKKYLPAFVLLLSMQASFAQPPKNTTVKQKAPAPSEMNKAIEDAMQGMSEAEKVEMRKMMKGIMPGLQNQNNKRAFYPEVTNNKKLVPEKDAVLIATLSGKMIGQSGMAGYASTLLNKLFAKGDAIEMAMAKKIIAQSVDANAIGGAALLCMLQGHPQVAMALSMKAVLADPANANWQNNMASLLTQYGYPEQAIPVLKQLKIQYPQNSTVLNNLGQAWLALGETDSAAVNIKKAGGLNPYHPEAKQTEGVIEETEGNTEKATEDYIKAMESSINPFTEMLLKNSSGQSGVNKVDFEKLKRCITIYEYFPKDWIKVPRLSDNVYGYENDMSIKNGYDKMFEAMEDQIEKLKDASNAEVEALFQKGETEFVQTMAAENIKGLSMMSKPATIVQIILQIYLHQWMMDYQKEGSAVMEDINTQRIAMTKSEENDKCPDYDRKNNKFLAYANPIVREFHAKKIEEFRVWLNAFCTWSWYITGNPKNTILTACIAWTDAMAQMYRSAIDAQYVEAPTCVKNNGDGVSSIAVPEIPNFSCPAVVSIPVGADWQQLSNTAGNFNANSFGVKQNVSSPVPHGSIAFSASPGAIAQAGRDPFTKTANGSMTPGMINGEELTPLTKIPLDDLTPLTNIPPDELTPLPDLRKSKLAKELLRKMMTADCKNVKSSKDIFKETLERMMKKVKELEAYENVIEQIKSLESEIEQKELNEQHKEQLKKQIERMQQETDKMDKYEDVQHSKKEIEKIIKEMEVMDDKKFMKDQFDKIMQSIDEMEATPALLKNIQQNGLQPTISSGMQVPGTFAPVKGIFN